MEMIVHWITIDDIENWRRGHGVEFHLTNIKGLINPPVAFLDGYDWLHFGAKEVTVYIVKPDVSFLTEPPYNGNEVINQVKKAIMTFLNNKKYQKDGQLTEDVYAWFNA